MATTGKLYLIPTDIGNKNLDDSIPPTNRSILKTITFFGCENIKTGRRFLINAGIESPIPEHIKMVEIRNDEATGYEQVIDALMAGENAGYMSEAGNPCIADPGERLVSMAHDKNITVVPLVGPSSILLALIASGLNAERFTFNGYLDRNQGGRQNDIRDLIKAVESGYTQVFMETPYRNNQMIQDLTKNCPDHFRLCLAADINTENAFIKTKSIGEWRRNAPDLNKKPTIFVLGSGF